MPEKQEQITNACVEVAVDVPLRQCFSYLVGKEFPPIGARVKVPFGRRHVIGVVVAHSKKQPKNMTLKTINLVLDKTPLFSDSLIKLVGWIKEYYHHPLGEVWRVVMPKVLRNGMNKHHGLVEDNFRLDSVPFDWQKQLQRAPVQLKIIQALSKADTPLNMTQIKRININARAPLQALCQKKWVKKGKSITLKADEECLLTKKKKLTPSQKAAFKNLQQKLGEFSCRVLEGVTGSGKTEVYFSLIDAMREQGKQTLVLLPEIALTDQHFTRFRRRFGKGVAQIHSGQNDQARYRVWWMAHVGEIDIILATRSGVFMMFDNLGLIIVDEEHDLSYKQAEGLRYHARSVAIKRAQLENIPIVLGSATPCFETLHNVQLRRFGHVVLNQRIGRSKLPKVDLIDLHQNQADLGLSQPVKRAIQATLDAHQQALIFINRRGYAPVLYCSLCHWTVQCKRCDAKMVSHRNQQSLQCHHCGARRTVPQRCDTCGEKALLLLGEGTQRIEETLSELFPSARIQRFDRDALPGAKQLHNALEKVHNNQIDILVGTQLLSKGHDFSNLNLVVVINADQGLHSVDFRATEQMVQQLIQVAGRAGRQQQQGRVMIQSRFTSQGALLSVQKHDYSTFAHQELKQRELAGFPPYAHMALWRARAKTSKQALSRLGAIANIGRSCQPAETLCFDVVPSPMFKRAGQFHVQLLVSARRRRILHTWLDFWLKQLEKQPKYQSVKWSIDVDPLSLF